MQQNYKISQGQTLPDVCVNIYGTFDVFVKMLQYAGLQASDDIGFTTPFIYNDSLVIPKNPSTYVNDKPASTLRTIKGLSTQNLSDLLTETYGTFDKYLQLAMDWNVSALVGTDFSFKSYIFDLNNAKNRPFIDSLTQKGIRISNNLLPSGSPNVFVLGTQNYDYIVTQDSNYIQV